MEDWSAQICADATLEDLDKKAILKARAEYKVKNKKLADEVDSWDDRTFLDKAKITQYEPYVIYRNQFLANAMVNLNMIDTIGSGIKKIFLLQM